MASALAYSGLLNLIKNPVNFESISPIYGLHIPVINCKKCDLHLKFPLISLITYFSQETEICLDEIPFICLDDDSLAKILVTPHSSSQPPNVLHQNFISLVDHNLLDEPFRAL